MRISFFGFIVDVQRENAAASVFGERSNESELRFSINYRFGIAMKFAMVVAMKK
jgi:hypothetical protein